MSFHGKAFNALWVQRRDGEIQDETTSSDQRAHETYFEPSEELVVPPGRSGTKTWIGAFASIVVVVVFGWQPVVDFFSPFDVRIIEKTTELSSITYPFTVLVTNVKDAKIRVLNIGPRYEPGMELPAGEYSIEVSAKGYETDKPTFVGPPVELGIPRLLFPG